MRALPVLVAVLAVALAGCVKNEKKAESPADILNDPSANIEVDKDFGAKVRAYLIQNPEVLVEVSQALQAKQEAETLTKRANVSKFRGKIERDSRDFVINPNGKVTVVEFYDYNCGYCKVIAPEVATLARENPNVRFVFKDFTLGQFGPTSEYAAAASRLLNQKGVFLESYTEMMSRKPLTDAMVDDILRRNGIDPAKARELEATANQRKYLEDVRTLAASIGLDGTPAFIVGDQVIPGADPDALKAAIAGALAGSR